MRKLSNTESELKKKQLLIKKQQTINFEKKVKLALLNHIIF